jgi:HNH endonuclease
LGLEWRFDSLIRNMDWLISRTIPVPFSGCWVWDGACSSAGYAQYRLPGGSMYAHRLAYELAKGPIPDGLDIDHLCRVRCCVNPDHLEAVTRSANLRRGVGVAQAAERLKVIAGWQRHWTHCKRGHEFTPENTYIQPNSGGRSCRICRNRDAKHRYQSKKDRR